MREGGVLRGRSSVGQGRRAKYSFERVNDQGAQSEKERMLEFIPRSVGGCQTKDGERSRFQGVQHRQERLIEREGEEGGR